MIQALVGPMIQQGIGLIGSGKVSGFIDKAKNVADIGKNIVGGALNAAKGTLPENTGIGGLVKKATSNGLWDDNTTNKTVDTKWIGIGLIAVVIGVLVWVFTGKKRR